MQEPKIYGFKGLNSRGSDLTKDPLQATNLKNVFVDRNKKGSLVKRYGTDLIAAPDSGLGYGIAKYIEDNFLVCFGDDVQKIISETVPVLVALENISNLTLSQKIFKALNVKKNLYFLNEDERLLKFDGINYYRAGIPNPAPNCIFDVVPSSAAGATKSYVYKIQYMAVDRNGIYVYSDVSGINILNFYTIEDVGGASFDMSIAAPCFDYNDVTADEEWKRSTVYAADDVVIAPDNSTYICHSGHTSKVATGTLLEDFQSDKIARWYLIIDKSTGYNTKFAKVNGNQTNTNTVTVDAGHNYIEGDVIVVKKSAAWITAEASATRASLPFFEFVPIRNITNKTATTITFDGDSYSASFVDDEILSNVFVLLYQKEYLSVSEYLLIGQYGIDPNYVAIDITFFPSVVEALGVEPTYVQTPNLPLVASDMMVFQNLMFLITGDYDVSYSIPTSHETFPDGDNNLDIGSREDGKLIALANVDDYAFFLKEYDIYFGTGNFGTGQGLRIWESGSDKIGCIARDSVQVLGKNVMFLSDKGFYWVSAGNMPEEIGYNINDIIINDNLPDSSTALTLDLEGAISYIDTKRKHYLCAIKGTTYRLIFIFDYVEQEWWLMVGTGNVMRADGGIASFKDTLFFQTSDGGNLNFEIDDKNDNGAAIEAFYDTIWHNSGMPALKKKYVRAKIYSLLEDEFVLTVKSQIDWNNVDKNTKEINFDSSTCEGNAGLDKNMSQSARLRFENNVLDEDMVLNGYELKTEPTVREMRKR